MPTFHIPPKNNRIGFHYFPDANHFRESDLYTWLPELKTLEASWLVLNAPADRAIPEFFINGLKENGIVGEVLVMDDNSPDGTATRVRELQVKHSRSLHLLERSGKLGLGTAYIKGFQWAMERGYRYLCEMDADFSHNPNDQT